MLQIHCPYCDETRDEIEFAHAGEAHYVRPDAKEQAEMSDKEWSHYMFIRDNIRGDTACLLYTSPSPRDRTRSRMPSSA